MKVLLNTRELAEVYGVGRDTVWEWRSRKGFPYHNVDNKYYGHDLNEVEEYFENKSKGLSKCI